MKKETAIALTKEALGLVGGWENTEVKWLEEYETDNNERPVKAIQIGGGDGEMWIYRDMIEIEVPSIKLVGGAMDKIKVEGYVLEALEIVHNYPNEPDWADVVIQREEQNFLGILSYMVGALFGERVNGFCMAADHRIDEEEDPWPGELKQIKEF